MSAVQSLRVFLAILSSTVASIAIADEAQITSPEAVFSSLQSAIARHRGGDAYLCMTDKFVERLLFSVWQDRTLSADAQDIVRRHLDEPKRLQLSREQLPIHLDELQTLLGECWKDKRSAATLALELQPDIHFLRVLAHGQLTQVKVSGDEATAVVAPVAAEQAQVGREPDKQEFDLQFQKTERGWRLSHQRLSDGELVADGEKLRPKSWTNESRPKYATPEEVQLVFEKACLAADTEAIWNCMTPSRRCAMFEENVNRLTERGLVSWYVDLLKRSKLSKIIAIELPRDRGHRELGLSDAELLELKDVYERMKFAQTIVSRRCLLESVDPETFLGALVKIWDEERRNSKPDPEELKSRLEIRPVVIKGDRALRKEILHFEDSPEWDDSFTSTMYYVKTDGGWQIDAATADEHVAPWRRHQEHLLERRKREKY